LQHRSARRWPHDDQDAADFSSAARELLCADSDSRTADASAISVPSWPEPLDAEAFHGPLGDWVRLIEPHTEADPAALLLQALAAIGNLTGRGPYFWAEADQHFTVLYVALVGRTAKGRKGTSEGHIRRLVEAIEPEYARRRMKSGLSTGFGAREN
jgi:hypothetical protein